MELCQKKQDTLFLAQYIQRLSTENEQEIYNVIHELSMWLQNRVVDLKAFDEFSFVHNELLSLMKIMAEGKALSLRYCNGLISALKQLQGKVMNNVEILVFISPQYQDLKLEYRKEVEIITISDTKQCIKKIHDEAEKLIYLFAEKGEFDEIEEIVDIALNYSDVYSDATQIYPIDVFTYDRLYLTAKMNRVQKGDTKILLAGSSYSMVGLLENEMPYTATNVAINAQDPYYSFLSINKAIEMCPKIEVAVLSFAYYFFFTDMTDIASDYYINVLSKVNYPVYKDINTYKGELRPLYAEVQKTLIYDAVFPTEGVRDNYHGKLLKKMEELTYYNDIMNPRPESGMLSYNFREKNDEKNFAGGKIRAEAHNKNFSMERGLKNQKLLDEFLVTMQRANKRIILFVPPASKFYRAAASQEIVEKYYELVMPVIQKYSCCSFIDFFGSENFNEEDFQDYDHLNTAGAKKLSKIIADCILEG